MTILFIVAFILDCMWSGMDSFSRGDAFVSGSLFIWLMLAMLAAIIDVGNQLRRSMDDATPN